MSHQARIANQCGYLSSRVFQCLAFLVTALLLSSSAVAQIGGSGSLQGTVTDPSGAVVAGATVTATSAATNAVSTQQTTSSGSYTLAALPPGVYTISVTAPGFQRLTQQSVTVDALAVATVNLTMSVGSATDVVTVTEAPPQIDSSSATLGGIMRNEEYSALPLAMNAGPRDPTAFVALVPGVQALSSQAAGSSFATFNGGQPYMNEVYIEGIPMTNAAAQGETRNLAYSVSVEAVDQFQVQTNNSPAEYQGQGIENFTIKSGSNKFHGAAYEYFRNTVLDARGYFPTFRPTEKQNQFGGRVGGFLFKDKLFFFGNYDGYRYRAASNPTAQSVPNTAFLRGDFSALIPAGTDCNATPVAGCIFDPLSTSSGPNRRTAFAGNIIPASRISSVSASLASYLPTVDPSAGFGNNYITLLPVGLNTDSTTDRLDYNFSQRQRAYAIFSVGKYTTVPFAGVSANTSALPLPYAATRIVTEKPMTIQLHHLFTVTPNLLNQFGYSYARLAIPITSATSAGQYPTK
ncbi:MAG TPA: carboxypeptidase-like regulatory domain-containing protein, partial [Edaphobacter sp.]|nr:carboxypeptidase-like regulatory domain-containing protein [Edaphobacter sp.]